MAKKIPRIGFDLDGVLLYNPTRLCRPIIGIIKKQLFHIDPAVTEFYIPKTGLVRQIWKSVWAFFHISSLFIAPGYDEIKNLTRQKKIEAYIISARFPFLRSNFEKWLKKLDASSYFHSCYLNSRYEQPHLFKERMIRQLKLDYFIDDNWDIVRHLSLKNKKLKVFWVYNIFDRHIAYSYKFPSLKEAIKEFKKQIGLE